MSGVKGQKKAISKSGKFLYGAGGLSSVTQAAFLLSFVTLFSHTDTLVLLVSSTVGIGLSVFLMPLCYAFINGNTSIATGRYHLYMIVSGLISAMSFMLMLGADGGKVAQGFFIGGFTFLYALSVQVYSYCCYAAGKRFDGSGLSLFYRFVFSLVSIVIAALAVCLFYGGTRFSMGESAAVCAIISLAGVAAAYFSTVKAMPCFIRLEPRHKRSFKLKFLRFTAPLKNRAVLLFCVAGFLLAAGITVSAAAIPIYAFSYVFGFGGIYKAVVTSASGIIAASGAFAAFKIKSGKKNCIASVVLSSVMLACAAVISVFLFTGISAKIILCLTYAFAAVSAVSIGFTLAAVESSKAYVCKHSYCTAGKYHTLFNCALSVGAALGVALVGMVSLFAENLSAAVAAAVAVSAGAAFVLTGAVALKFGYVPQTEGE